MYRIRLDENNQNKLIYYCSNCGNEDTEYDKSDICVSRTNAGGTKTNDQTYNINEYTKYDPTLPRINTILCPNPNCDTNKKSTLREIIYIRYDNINMKYLYLCSTCDTTWKP
jgi:DNA-directed RNA polymerase subunit M/transcription elongation factor TFIIS